MSVQARSYVQLIGWQNTWEQAPSVPPPLTRPDGGVKPLYLYTALKRRLPSRPLGILDRLVSTDPCGASPTCASRAPPPPLSSLLLLLLLFLLPRQVRGGSGGCDHRWLQPERPPTMAHPRRGKPAATHVAATSGGCSETSNGCAGRTHHGGVAFWPLVALCFTGSSSSLRSSTTLFFGPCALWWRAVASSMATVVRT